MGQSTDACIAFGVDFGEECDFPWVGDKYDDDIQEWWRDVKGCSVSQPTNWDDEEANSAYFAALQAWGVENPLPVEDVYHCSNECPMYILAVPGTHITASRGYPQKLIQRMFNEPKTDTDEFGKFCELYGIELPKQPEWLLFSYWA